MSARLPTIRTANAGAWVAWMGEPLRYATLGTDTLDRYALSVGGVAAGGGPKPHRHGFAETFVLLRGSATFTAGTTGQPARAAVMNAPEWNFSRPGSLPNVPSGKNTSACPLWAVRSTRRASLAPR